MTTTPMTPADLYIARRSTPASQATARSALNTAARALGFSTYTDCDWVLEYRQAALIRAAVNALSPGWAKVVWSTVRQVTMTARSMRLIDSDSAVSILELPAPRGSGGRRGRTPDDSEVGRLLDVAAQDPTLRGRRDAAVIAVLAGGGLRAAETRLHVSHFDAVSGRLDVVAGKGRRRRTVPLPRWAVVLLEEWITASGVTGHLLVGVDRWGNLTGPLSGQALNDIVQRLAADAGLGHLTCHSFRRYAITGVLHVADVGLAQLLAGHADVSTTIRSYDARDIDDLACAVGQRSTPRQQTRRRLAVA